MINCCSYDFNTLKFISYVRRLKKLESDYSLLEVIPDLDSGNLVEVIKFLELKYPYLVDEHPTKLV